MIIEIDDDDVISTLEFCKAFKNHLEECVEEDYVAEEDIESVIDSIGELSGLIAIFEKILYLELQDEKRVSIVH